MGENMGRTSYCRWGTLRRGESLIVTLAIAATQRSTGLLAKPYSDISTSYFPDEVPLPDDMAATASSGG